ncbi:MAG: amino acid aminotransferase [Chlamydiales bacterium 38-26]|nr:aspartate/tyrosine/aromatic aminotransferase [Chlamydiales bacterium]OJV11094.1 MAG: amino acid aminotransferase [Chlamydiales bacterium 38-26]
MSFFKKIQLLPADPILSLPLLFAADERSNKVNLGVGAYRNEKGQPVVLAAVREAEEWIFSKKLHKEYLPIEGHPLYLKESTKLIYGADISLQRVAALQTVGGLSALRLIADFFVHEGYKDIYISDPSWPNHEPTFYKAGMSVHTYPYYNPQTHTIDFESMCGAIKQMPKRSVVLLQACCHNPTGLDLSKEQWKILSELIKSKKIIPFFDLAYQGFGASLEEDAWPIRYFLSQNHELFTASSYSKNLGLYGERVGVLSWYVESEMISKGILSHVKSIVRGMYSNPPMHGALIVATILESPILKKIWIDELREMQKRIEEMRIQLMLLLNEKNIHQNFNFMQLQKGMFSLSGLDSSQVYKLQKEYGIYMLPNGRISIPGLTKTNIEYVAQSIATVVNQI